MAIKFSCQDFLGFQEALRKMRDIDDKIIYALNSSLPTESFKRQFNGESTCRDLYDKLNSSHKQREDALKECILLSANNVKSLKDKKNKNIDDIELDKKYKSEQRKLRVLQYELNVEDIIKDRSYKAFNEKCRTFFEAGAAS